MLMSISDRFLYQIFQKARPLLAIITFRTLELLAGGIDLRFDNGKLVCLRHSKEWVDAYGNPLVRLAIEFSCNLWRETTFHIRRFMKAALKSSKLTA